MSAPHAQSRLTFDYRNTMTVGVGDEDGVSESELDSVADRIRTAHQRIMNEHNSGEQRWMNLPDDQPLVAEITRYVAEQRGRYRDFVLIGIGGSSLGAIATVQALTNPFRNLLGDEQRHGPRFFVLDNPDPEKVHATLDMLDLDRTLVNVVTKSGQTSETMANFLVMREALISAVGKDAAPSHIVATTDPKEGLLRKLADQEGYRTFPVPPGVDGRQTVLSAVGLLPAAFCGVDIGGLLEGAAAMRARCQSDDVHQNPAYLMAALAYLADKKHGKHILVTMPYADALFGLSDWFRQLWAESLGKRLSVDGKEVFAGQTPVKSLGAIDQHSQIQLYTEGPNDKLISLIGIGHYRQRVPVSEPPASVPELDFVKGAELGLLLDRERTATAWALRQAKRPNLTIMTPTIDAFALGEFFYLYQAQTVMAGALYDINPFGQPGVEAGKNATYALMGRHGYEQLRQELTTEPPDAGKYTL